MLRPIQIKPRIKHTTPNMLNTVLINASSKYGEVAARFSSRNPTMNSGPATPSKPSPVKKLLRGALKNGPLGGGKIAMRVKHIMAMPIVIPITSRTFFLENVSRTFSLILFCSLIVASPSKAHGDITTVTGCVG